MFVCLCVCVFVCLCVCVFVFGFVLFVCLFVLEVAPALVGLVDIGLKGTTGAEFFCGVGRWGGGGSWIPTSVEMKSSEFAQNSKLLGQYDGSLLGDR